ncbi:MAG: peptidoglycan-binding protein [Gemmatimonadales bacterium]
MSDDKVTPTDHTARLGDHLSRVAATFGFRSYAPLWNHPDNRVLRTRRANPNILAEGDSIHVPELIDQEVDRPTEQRHRFRAELHPLEVRISLRQWTGTPRTDEVTEVLLDGRPGPFTVVGPGVIAIPVGVLTDRVVVTTAAGELVGRVGFLQPVDTPAGQRERLTNLGYQAGDSADPRQLDFRSAVEEFQCDHGLVVDGVVGPVTRGKLVAVHGS